MPGARRFEALTCWQEARQLGRSIEAWIRRTQLPDEGYADQLRRAAVSVQANIAEGFDRFTHREFHRFLGIAKGSVAEVRALLFAALDRGILDTATHADLTMQAERVAKRIARLMYYLRASKMK